MHTRTHALACKVPANLVLVKGFSVVGIRAGMELMLNPVLVTEMCADLQKWTQHANVKERHALAPLVTEYSLERFREVRYMCKDLGSHWYENLN